MNIGFGLVTAQRNSADPERRTDTEIYRQAIELARETEEAGLASYWVSEHHFWDDGYLPSLLPVLAAASAVTERIALGTAVLLAPFHDPLRLAEDAAVVDLLSQGRLILGLGLGWRDEEFAGFGVSRRRRVALLEESIATLRAAWAPGATAGDPAVAVTPKPPRAQGPPIWIGGSVDAAVDRAARLADGFVASMPPWDLGELARHGEALRSGPRPVAVSAHCEVFIWDGPEDPHELVREFQWYTRWKYGDALEAHAGRAGREPARAPPLAQRQADGLTGDEQRRVDQMGQALIGRPEQVLEGLRAMAPHISPDGHLIARAYFPGLPWEVQRRQVRLLGEIAKELDER